MRKPHPSRAESPRGEIKARELSSHADGQNQPPDPRVSEPSPWCRVFDLRPQTVWSRAKPFPLCLSTCLTHRSESVVNGCSVPEKLGQPDFVRIFINGVTSTRNYCCELPKCFSHTPFLRLQTRLLGLVAHHTPFLWTLRLKQG